MSALQIYVAAVAIAVFGLIIASSSEIWGWAIIPALASLYLYFAAVQQERIEREGED